MNQATSKGRNKVVAEFTIDDSESSCMLIYEDDVDRDEFGSVLENERIEVRLGGYLSRQDGTTVKAAESSMHVP